MDQWLWSLHGTGLGPLHGTSDIITDPGCSRITDSGMAFGCSFGPEVTMAPSSTGHLDLYGSGYSMALGHQHGLKARDPDMALRNSPDPPDTMARGDSTGHSDLYVPGCLHISYCKQDIKLTRCKANNLSGISNPSLDNQFIYKAK
ncbi:hypothetical protein STEG23_014274, partial [Scotinomys teguina]